MDNRGKSAALTPEYLAAQERKNAEARKLMDLAKTLKASRMADKPDRLREIVSRDAPMYDLPPESKPEKTGMSLMMAMAPTIYEAAHAENRRRERKLAKK